MKDLGGATSYGMNSIQNYNRYSDALAIQRKRSVLKRLVLSILMGFTVVAVTGYFLFFTPYLQITDISISGLKTVASEEVESLIASIPIGKQATIFQNILSVFQLINVQKQKNIIFFNSNTAQEKVLAQFPVIKSVEIKKEYPHKLIFDIVERSPTGTWCYSDRCYYFDEDGVLWGKALKSSGPLLLTVEDKRGDINDLKEIEPNLLDSINKIIAGFDDMGIRVKKMEIPAGLINDLMVHTAEGYYVLADSSSNIDKQLDTLRIFLKNNGEDLHPEYIDIRLEGRVYYR